MIEFTGRRMNGHGSDHQGIAKLQWVNRQSGNSDLSDVRPTLVDFVRKNPGQSRVKDSSGKWAEVRVVEAQPPYLRSYADGVPANNLLALPEI
ncbi:DUF3892 domain-containing protein [Frankia sp. Hr75.2]|nr:DUF3892 domain-containing protein [Frankia sp. Hr75.2]